MNYYIDFDHTLFDTYEFKKEIVKILEKNGLDESYLKTDTDKPQLFNIRKLFENISVKTKTPLEKLIQELEELFERLNELVYEDSIEFLKYLKSKNHKLHILTWGDKEFQKEKVTASKLDKYFDEIIYAEELKYTLDIDYANGIFIDDSIRDLTGLYNAKAKQVFRIKRKNGKDSLQELGIKEILEFDSLKELQKYLEKQN